MTNKEKIDLLKASPSDDCSKLEYFYTLFEKADAIKYDYNDYMNTKPIDCDAELARLDDADYDLCCALMTMLLRETRWVGERCFERRYENGDVQKITSRIINILENTDK